MVFDGSGAELARHQLEHEQILPRPGWVEHDPLEIWDRSCAVIQTVMDAHGLRASDLAAIGITNQRETTVVWNRRTGRPYCNAIVWQDTRTLDIVNALVRAGHTELLRARTGLPPATYFAGSKLAWILRNVAGVRADAERGDALFGTIDSWLLWNLTGGIDGGAHLTDVTNASRTMLMNLQTLDWDEELLALFEIPRPMLATIRPSVDAHGYGAVASPGCIVDVRLGAVLGDQQAAMLGQVCLQPGQAKNTYGTGNFLLVNTGEQIVPSTHGLLATVCCQFAGRPATYALEGSVAVTGAAVQWLRDQLGVIAAASDIEGLAEQVEDNGGVYFVPAFSGLYAPHWRSDARGAIVGLSRFNTRAHLARATLEAICYQSRDVLEAMQRDVKVTLDVLKVDGGITANNLCMQLQADILGLPVSRPRVVETTALGAAYGAGLALGLFADAGSLRANWHEGTRWEPQWTTDRREAGYADWKRAVERSLDWV